MPTSAAPPTIVPTLPPFMGSQMLPPPPSPPNLKHGLDTIHSSDEPANKKIRNEDSLIPEDVFLKRNTSTVIFKVVVPNITEKPEWIRVIDVTSPSEVVKQITSIVIESGVDIEVTIADE